MNPIPPFPLLTRFTPTSVGTTSGGGPGLSCKSRFTPTSVGTTHRTCVIHIVPFWFTPTSVGTTPASKCCVLTLHGSPPPAWGQPNYRQRSTLEAVRFTPTSVGTTTDYDRRLLKLERFTPTSVGTTYRKGAGGFVINGSPPPAWGQRGVSIDVFQCG